MYRILVVIIPSKVSTWQSATLLPMSCKSVQPVPAWIEEPLAQPSSGGALSLDAISQHGKVGCQNRQLLPGRNPPLAEDTNNNKSKYEVLPGLCLGNAESKYKRWVCNAFGFFLSYCEWHDAVLVFFCFPSAYFHCQEAFICYFMAHSTNAHKKQLQRKAVRREFYSCPKSATNEMSNSKRILIRTGELLLQRQAVSG